MSEVYGKAPIIRIDWRSVPYAAALFSLPLILLAANRSWIYTTVGWVDPWIYRGYDFHPESLLRDFPNAYYGTRVPWTTFGWLVHRVAGDELSLYLIALALVYSSAFATFYALNLLFHNRDAAFICACLVATNSWLLWAFGFGYIDGPTIACMFISFAALVAIVSANRWRTAAVICGASTAAFVIITIPYVLFLPILCLALLLLNFIGAKRPVFNIVLYWGSGCIGFVLLTCITNWMLGGNFFFFAPEIAAALPILGRQVVQHTNEYWAPWQTWFWSAPWLLVPGLSAMASIVLLALRGPTAIGEFRSGVSAPAYTCELQLLIVAAADVFATAVFALMQAAHLSMLLYYYRANALLPFSFLILGACLAAALSRMSRGVCFSLSVATPIVCLAPWVLGVLGLLKVDFPSHGASATATGAAAFIGVVPETLWTLLGAGFLVSLFVARQWLFVISTVVFMTVVSIGTIAPGSDIRIPENPRFRDQAMAVFDAARAIDLSPSNSAAFFWWDKTDPDRNIFRSLGAMYNWNSYFPPAPTLGDRVIVLYSDRTLLLNERRRLGAQHLFLGPPTIRHIQRGTSNFYLEIRDVSLDLSAVHRVRLPLSALEAPSRTADGGANIITPTQPWAYAATLNIPTTLKRRYRSTVYFRIRMNVSHGTIGAGVTTADGRQWVDRRFVRAALAAEDIYLTVPTLSNTAQIVFCNGEDTAASTGSVSSIELLYRDPGH